MLHRTLRPDPFVAGLAFASIVAHGNAIAQPVDTASTARTTPRVDTTGGDASGAAPVTPFLDTVFVVRGRLGSFPPAARAAAIPERIRKVAADA